MGIGSDRMRWGRMGLDGARWDGMGQISCAPYTEYAQGVLSSSFTDGCCEEQGHSNFFLSLTWSEGAMSQSRER